MIIITFSDIFGTEPEKSEGPACNRYEYDISIYGSIVDVFLNFH